MAAGIETGNDEMGAAEQIRFIESMILEGRRTTEYWGWNFLLWGVAYLAAMGWSSYFVHSRSALWAWPVTMLLATAITVFVARSKAKGQVVTMRSRAIAATWIAIGMSIFLFAFPAIIGRHFGDGHAFIAGIEVLLGAAHVASGIILRWRGQIAIGCVWWAAALIANLTQSSNGAAYPFLAGTLICNIGFGAYLMYCEARDKARLRAGQVAHA